MAKLCARARIFRGTPRNLRLLAQRLKAGDIVAVPTETVYGLAGNALSAQACRKIFRAKRRPLNDPLIVHISSVAQLERVAQPNPAALLLARKFWPGPLTMVLPKQPTVPAIVSAGQNSVAVRAPAHPLFRQLLRQVGLPLAAPSANPFGYVSPTTAAHVREGLGQELRYILDGGPSRIGVESTIVDLRQPTRPRVLRPGAISREQLAAALGHKVGLVTRSSRPKPLQATAQLAPGQLARHYSPRTPVVLHRRLGPPAEARDAYIYFRAPSEPAKTGNVFWLDRKGDLAGAARRLFAVLREVDRLKFRSIHAELAPGAGLSLAINDRLRRAAAR
jgi:L-threonylcarbamoyladenylate synthase